MRVSYGIIVEHAELGAVVVVGHPKDGYGRPDLNIVRITTLDEWRTAPYVDISKAQGGRIEARVREVYADTLRPRPRAEGDLAAFLRSHRTPGWKPAPLPKPRKLPKLSDERFARLMREQGARQISE